MESVSLDHSIKPTKSLVNAKVIAVSDFSTGLLCILCDAGYISKQRVHSVPCRLWVSALLTLSSGGFQIELLASDDILAWIAELPLREITRPFTAPFTVIYNSKSHVDILELNWPNLYINISIMYTIADFMLTFLCSTCQWCMPLLIFVLTFLCSFVTCNKISTLTRKSGEILKM